MATSTLASVVTTTVYTSQMPTSTSRAPNQGGILEGSNPADYDPKNPIITFIIQAGIVIICTRLLHYPLSKLRQPRVIAEVLTGIILGPSIMGRIPGFTEAIFPTASMAAFSVAANLGLILFLFLVGLEVDLRFLAGNWPIALSVGAAGMAIPFGLGWAIAYGLYHQFRDDSGLKPIGYGTYGLFISIALAITAFPVLCRILTSLKLLQTPVGVIVLAAGVGNDVVGWILLALCVALVNAGAGLTALYILLVAIGYVLFIAYAVRPAFIYILQKSGSFQNGPTQSVVALTVLMALTSAFFTGIIGIHPIFGGFIIGLICPHEGGFAVKMTEKLEDLVSVLFLPLYFALSGLSTNLGLLNDGITWAYVIAVTAVAFFGKIAGGTFASRLNGLVWRESLTIGVMMSCKGLVELIVLNIGLQANILSHRTFTIFVVMALLTTFATTPLTMWLYPPWYQQKLELWKKGKIDWEGNPTLPDGVDSDDELKSNGDLVAQRILFYLRLDGLPSLLKLMNLLGGHRRAEKAAPNGGLPANSKNAMTSLRDLRRPLQVHGVRLMELTERESSVMKVSEIEDYAARDPVIKAFETFAHSQDIAVAGHISVVPEHSFASTLLGRAHDVASDLLILPWSETGTMSEHSSLFDSYSLASADPLANRAYGALVSAAFAQATSCNVGVFLDKRLLSVNIVESSPGDRPGRTLTRTMTGISLAPSARRPEAAKLSASNGYYHIIVPYRSLPDDILALRLAMQLAENDRVSVTVISGELTSEANESLAALKKRTPAPVQSNINYTSPSLDLTRSVKEAVQRKSTGPSEDNDEDAEQIILVGRNGERKATDSSGSLRVDTRLIGWGANYIQMLNTAGLKASVLVVQARKEARD